jgi:hypothetical protein
MAYHGKSPDPVPLNAKTFDEELLTGQGIDIQLAAYSTPGLNLHYRISGTSGVPGDPAPTIATFKAEGVIKHLGHAGNFSLRVNPGSSFYLQWYLTDDFGNSVVAGANDYLYIASVETF